MSGVSCRACRWILDWLESQSLDAAELFASSSALPQQAVLRDETHQITWPEFLALCAALRDLCSPVFCSPVSARCDEPVLTRVGRELAHELFQSKAWRHRVRGSTPAALYTEHASPALGFLFSSLCLEIESHSDGTLRIEAALPHDAGDAGPFFELCAGVAQSAPELVGLPPCDVATDVRANRARFRVSGLRTFPVETSCSDTDRRIAEISLDVLGRRLGEVRSPEAAAALLFDLLRERFGCPAARLWLVRDPEARLEASGLALLRAEGETDKPPSRSLPLALGERPIGRLDLWEPEEAAEELPEILEGLLPWFTLVLETAAVRESALEAERRPGEEGRFADLVRNAGDVLCEVSGDGRMIYVSPAVSALLGHGPEYYEGKSFIEFVAEQDRPRHLADFAAMQATGRADRVVFRTLHADGSPRWLEATARPFQTARGRYRVCCVIRDVDQRRAAEAARGEREEQQRALLGNLDEVALVLDHTGRLLLRSGHAASYLGLADTDALLDELIGRVHPEDRQTLSRTWHSAPAEGPVKRAEFRLLDPARKGHRWLRGTLKPLETASGERAHSLVLRDITERRQSERSLRAIAAGISTEREQFFPFLVRHLAEALGSDIAHIVLVDPETSGPGRTLALWMDGELVLDESQQHSAAAPCCEVLQGEHCCYPTGVSQLFGEDSWLAARGIDSHVGIPLALCDGSVIGHLCCLGRRPLSDPDHARSMMGIFGQRATAELQREHDARALRRSEERYRTLAENARDIIVEVTTEPRLLYISPSAEEVLGFPLEELASGSHLDRIHPDDIDRVGRTFGRMLETEQGDQLVFRVRHSSGDWCWLETNARTYHAADGSLHIVANLRDITQRALAEQQREQLISIIQNSSDLIALTSLDGSMIFLNAAGRAMVGLESESDAASASLYDLLSPDEAREMEYRIMPAVHRSRQWSDELVLRHCKSGEPVATLANLFLIYGHEGQGPVAVAAICRDISARKRAEQALLESEVRYRMLAENPYDLISELDERGHFVYVSPNFETILGYSPASLLGQEALSLIHPVDRDAIAPVYRDTIARETTQYGSFRVAHRDGHHLWVETTTRAYRSADGRLMAVMISRDISERVEAAEALRESQEKLRQAQKMEAIGRLAGGIAHDFNNILTAITGYCVLLLESIDSDAPARSDADEILKAAERASALTHQLLAFSRRQVLQPKIIELNALVSDIDRMLRRLIGEHIELVSILEGELWCVKADPGQIQQVVLNLVVNARDAMPGGGRITIETDNVEIGLDDARVRDEIPPGSYVSLSVRDSGEGMSKETRDLIFEPFFTTKESGKGTGLGLSTVFGIVRQSGGHLSVDSTLGEGSTFRLYLPRAGEVDLPSDSNDSLPQFCGDETVLLVEDAAPVRKLIGRHLRRHGYQVLEAASGTEALRYGHRHRGPIHLLLTDVVMPKLDGARMAERIQSLRPETRVLYMSGFSDESLVRYGVSSDRIVLLEKPFTPTTLLRMVRAQLDRTQTPKASNDEPAALS